MTGDRDACLAAGMDDYVRKPISLVTLGNVVVQWLPRVETETHNTDPSVC